MVIECIRYEATEDQRAKFDGADEEASKLPDAPEHCARYEISRGAEGLKNHALRIKRGFRNSPGPETLIRSVRPFFDSMSDINHHEGTSVGSDGP